MLKLHSLQYNNLFDSTKCWLQIVLYFVNRVGKYIINTTSKPVAQSIKLFMAFRLKPLTLQNYFIQKGPDMCTIIIICTTYHLTSNY